MGSRIQILAVVTIIAVIVIGWAAPAAASNETTRHTTLQGIVAEARTMLQPFARQRNLTIEVEMPHTSPVTALECDRVRERVINLVANAIALSPENSTVVVKLSPAQELSVWIGNDQVAVSAERDIRDQAGNFFRIRSTAGKGTELSCRFVTPAISQLP